jgi:ABC-type transport system involved in multi-copper enzyme maturation permease subunit
MIRLTLRQFRMQAVVGVGALVIVAVIVAVTGPHLVHIYDTSVATCSAHGDCPTVTSAFVQNDHALQILLGAFVVVVPGLIGIFWGAPLVARELEAGTFRLAWTQSVTRTRWLAVKLGVVGLAGMVVAGLVSLMVTWWSSPLDRANMNVFGTFDQRGLVAVGYAAFAFALGATVGMLFRRTLPAMAVVLVVFVAARLAFLHWVRPQLITPALRTYALGAATVGGYGSTNGGPSTLVPNPPDIANVWIVSTLYEAGPTVKVDCWRQCWAR